MNDTSIFDRPDTLEAALCLLAKGDRTIAAGCTDLFPATERKVLPGPVVDISGIAELRGIQTTDEGLTIGATTTWSDIQTADLPPAFDGLKLAAREVGAKQIQNRGTIAGNLCNASPAADGVPPLLTLDAEVVLRSSTTDRQIPLTVFINGPRQTALAPDEMVTGIFVPAASMQGQSSFLKLGARSYLVISIAMVAARLVIDDGIVRHAALAIGSCSPVATRLPEAEAALIGHAPNPNRIHHDHLAPYLSPIDDIRADAGYRIETALELLRRTIAPLAEQVAA